MRLLHASVIAALFHLQINKDAIYCKLKLTPVSAGTNDRDKLTQCTHCPNSIVTQSYDDQQVKILIPLTRSDIGIL